MDDRKIKILNSIIKSYIDSKEPVGSRSLSKNSNIGISAATIRNEMSDLEDLGYLKKLHTSSGRVPSNSGYRHYVDALLADEIPFERGPQRLFNMQELKESNEFDNVIRNATKMLAAITNYTSFAMLPKQSSVYLKYINIVFLTPKDLVIIYIFNSKEVINDTIRLKSPVDKNTIDLINSLLNSTLVDLTHKDIINMLQTDVYDVLSRKHTVLKEVMPVIEKTIKLNSNARIIFEGVGNVFVYNDESVVGNQEIVNKLKSESLFMNLLSRDMMTHLQVFIGDEIGIDDFERFSIITVTFKNSQGIKGKIGVLGPNSMKYDKIISDIILVNKYINGHIERR